ncbi:MAG: methylamine utilization protein MauG [Erythrobacter sp.]|nr:methylamine utilization protein MauG [Erythrobacter sp.]MBA4163022.1 methylamine utilization protein MauG [Erythrobacter sp.]
MRMEVLRRAALANGAARAADLIIPTQPARVEVGRLIFESPKMSLNGAISCRDCHLDEFGSTDGLPNAVGVGGEGKGLERLDSNGRILPRNVLPFWGRGGKGFDTFFWDGRVRKGPDGIVSQFGVKAPSTDPLVVAAHLPSVELREMVEDTPQIRDAYVAEDVSDANSIQRALAQRFADDETIGPRLLQTYGKAKSDVTFSEIADALSQFIRHEFRMRPTAFERFVFDGGPITDAQLAGGILFYGRGRCASCHTGPYFTDFAFHSVAFPQAGFGKNGFGIDEGRYNATLDPRDRFLFRTPPLHNVTRTAPYSHSGSVTSLDKAIIAHFDPLRLVDTKPMTVRERSDLYVRLGTASRETLPSALTDSEVRQLVAFLTMLEFEAVSR